MAQASRTSAAESVNSSKSAEVDYSSVPAEELY
jgi:hypothetical protein